MEAGVRLEQEMACPGWEELAAFHRGRLSDSALEAVASHLSSCPSCESLFAQLASAASDDSLSGRIKQCLGTPASPTEPAYEAMESAARGMVPTGEAGAHLPDDRDAAEPVPRSVGPYDILAQVGRGGMGVVYHARHQVVRREVALKMLRAGAHGGRDARARFRIEGQAIARLQHPNVVHIYEFGESAGQSYFAMEWVAGGSLAGRLSRGPLPPREAAELTRTLARAVEAAHRQKVIHRDLKPSNVLLAGDGIPKISDFGLAKLLDDGEDGLTQSDVVLGTPAYMAPEQAAGPRGAVGPAADVYALGAILYETLTAEPPFRGGNKFEVLRRVREVEPVPPSRKAKGVPRALELICLKCLEKAAARRYPSAAALAADLDEWLRTGYAADVPGRLRRWTRVLRRRWGIVLVALVLPVGLAALSLGDPDRPRRRVEGDLRLGRSVSLIAGEGRPAWFRWRAGEAESHVAVSGDRSFTIETWGYCLLELVTDPQTDRYRFDVEVRHAKSNLPGEVGLYVARAEYPAHDAGIQCFTQVAFNDVRRGSDVPDGFVFAGPSGTIGRLNAVTVAPRIHSDPAGAPGIDRRLSSRAGPRFVPAGEGRGEWHRLAVKVTPQGVEARWDGKPFSMAKGEITEAIAIGATKLRRLRPDDPDVQALRPGFAPRGGLGLCLWRGSASFRAARVTPLSDES